MVVNVSINRKIDLCNFDTACGVNQAYVSQLLDDVIDSHAAL